MSPIVSLRSLEEPAYVLLGGLLWEDDSGIVQVLRGLDRVDGFAPEAGPTLRLFSTMRLESDALSGLVRLGGEPSDLAAMVEAGVLVRFPQNEEGIRAVLAPMFVRLTAPATVSLDPRTILLSLPNGRSLPIAAVTARVLRGAPPLTLGDSITSVAEEIGVGTETVWRHVVDDLTGILVTGAGHLAVMGAA